MKKFFIFFINTFAIIGWITFCLKRDPQLTGEWHLYIWTSFFAIFSFLDQFHWQSQELANSLHQEMEGNEKDSIRKKHEIRKIKLRLRKMLHWSWGFKMALVVSVGIFKFSNSPYWQVKYGAFGLSYGLVLGFLNISIFLWVYYLIFDHLSERYADNIEATKRREKALRDLILKP